MDIDEILERAEKVEEKEADGEQGNELLSAFKVRLCRLPWIMLFTFLICYFGNIIFILGWVRYSFGYDEEMLIILFTF